MKKHASTIILIIIFFVGLSVLLYPSVSNYIYQIHATHAVENYDQKLNTLKPADYTRYLSAARAYNDGLLRHGALLRDGDPVDKTYSSLLNLTGDGMMGYITIKKLGVQLPIYHGTSDAVLQAGAGHLEGSSLPVGGPGTHTIITGHRGLPSAKLFTDLDQMEVGDTFVITVLNQTLTYQVDNISIVLPQDVSKLTIVPGKDYATLITCTPYAVNTHRLLVRGVRTKNALELRVTADAMQIDPTIIAPIVAAPMLLLLLILLLTGSSRRRRSALHQTEFGKDGDKGL